MLRTTFPVILYALVLNHSLFCQIEPFAKLDTKPESDPIATVAGEVLNLENFNAYFAAIQTYADRKGIAYHPGSLKVLLSEQMVLNRILTKNLSKDALKLSPEEQAMSLNLFHSHYPIFPIENVPKTDFGKFMYGNIIRQFAFVKAIKSQLRAVTEVEVDRYLERTSEYNQKRLSSGEIMRMLYQRRLRSRVKDAFNTLYTTYEVENHLKERYVQNFQPVQKDLPVPSNLSLKQDIQGRRKPFSSLEYFLQN